MKNILVAALVVLGASQVMASDSVISYSCGSSLGDNSAALVDVIEGKYLNMFVQNYPTAGHLNFVAQGQLDTSSSTPSRLVFRQLTDWNNNPVAPGSAQTVIVTVSNGTVTSIELERFGAPLVYNRNCQLDDGSK